MQVLRGVSIKSQRFIHAFWQLRQHILKSVNPRVRAAHGVDFLEVMLLEHIGRGDVNPSDLAELMQIPAHGISRRLDSLEKGGLIQRSLDPDDARRRVLTLTEAGEGVTEEAQKTLDGGLEPLLSAVSKKDAATLIQAMEAMAQVQPQQVQPRETVQPQEQV